MPNKKMDINSKKIKKTKLPNSKTGKRTKVATSTKPKRSSSVKRHY